MDTLHQRSSRVSGNDERGASLRSDGHLDSSSSRLTENRFAPFYDEYYNDSASEYGDEEYFHRPRKADNYYGIRQEYLRSFTFVRDDEELEKKGAMKRFRAIVWAVLCCKYKSTQAKALREKISSSSARFFQDSSDYFSHSRRRFTVPSCIRLEVS